MDELELKRKMKSLVVPAIDADVRKLLRQLGEPITLFGERQVRAPPGTGHPPFSQSACLLGRRASHLACMVCRWRGESAYGSCWPPWMTAKQLHWVSTEFAALHHLHRPSTETDAR